MAKNKRAGLLYHGIPYHQKFQMTEIWNLPRGSFLLLERTELIALKKTVNKIAIILAVLLAIVAILAAGAVGIAVYVVTKDNGEGGGGGGGRGNGTELGSSCRTVNCEHGGSCIDLSPGHYVCSCVATFYGRHCEHSKCTYLYYPFVANYTTNPTKCFKIT